MKRVMVVTDGSISRWMDTRMGERAGFSEFAEIGLYENDTLIAGTIFDYYNGASINMHVAAVPGGRWLNREFLHFCFWYPFEQLRVKRVTGLVPASNKAARRFDEHLGFSLEATLRDAHPSGDMLVYRMYREECRWLNMKVKYGQTISTTCA